MKKQLLFLLILFLIAFFPSNKVYAQSCNTPSSISELNVNNVRAKIPLGASFWWDGSDGGYYFPNRDTAFPQVSAMFAGALWIGGTDPAGNLQLSATTYGLANGQVGYWAGPTPVTAESCVNWDRQFMVNAPNLNAFLNDWSNNGTINNPLHPEIAGWPGRGNPHFSSIHGFELPENATTLAPFWDENQDGLYNPMDGDYPDIKGASQAIWSISNTVGNTNNTNTTNVPMEIHSLAYAYASDDPSLNNTTFYDFKMINVAADDLIDTYVSLWVDADLGCNTDDYVGCIPEKNMAIIYNQDAQDGSPGCSCQQGIPTYCEGIPVMGIKLLKGPGAARQFGDNGELIHTNELSEADTFVNLGMTSFMVYNNAGFWDGPPQMTQPSIGQEYYNYMKGLWRDGSKPTNNGEEVDYLYPGNPGNMQSGDWTACSEDIGFSDRLMLINSGPFSMPSGAVNEFSFCVIGTENVAHPCPDISILNEYASAVENYYYQGVPTQVKAIEASQNEVLLAPNPMQDFTMFTLKDEQDQIQSIQLFSIDGKMVFDSKKMDTQQYELQEKLPSKGMYIYHLKTKNGKLYTGKLIKQ